MWFSRKAILRESIAGSQSEVLLHRSLLCYQLRHATTTVAVVVVVSVVVGVIVAVLNN
jgi:hypothetical protein